MKIETAKHSLNEFENQQGTRLGQTGRLVLVDLVTLVTESQVACLQRKWFTLWVWVKIRYPKDWMINF